MRLSGKNAGSKYKCFKSPKGVAYWSIKKAQENGFTGMEAGEVLDGRCKIAKAATGQEPGSKPGSEPAKVLKTKGKPGKKSRGSPGNQ